MHTHTHTHTHARTRTHTHMHTHAHTHECTLCNDILLPVLSYDVMLKCWDEDCQLRPTFAALRSQFDQMLSSKHKENYIHLLVDEEMPYYNLLPVDGSKESLPSLDPSPTPSDKMALQGSAGGSFESKGSGTGDGGEDDTTAAVLVPKFVDPSLS